MKRAILLIAACVIFVAATTEKKYNLEFTQSELGVLYECLDKSEASHVTVKALQDYIQKEYQMQSDTTKKK